MSCHPPGPGASPGPPPSSADSVPIIDDSPPALRELVESHVSAWETGAEPHALQVLADHPELLEFPILAAELAYAEYAVRLVRGSAPTPPIFCQAFPSVCRDFLWQMLNIHGSLLEENSSWLAVMRRQMAAATAPWPKVGTEWLGYQLHEELGRGGLARVYLAAELSVGGRQVVLKITPYETGEGHVQSNLIHDSLMPVLTVRRDESTGLTAIVMPYWGRATLMDVRDEITRLEDEQQRTAAPPAPDSVWDSSLPATMPRDAQHAHDLAPVTPPSDSAGCSAADLATDSDAAAPHESHRQDEGDASDIAEQLEIDLRWLVRDRRIPDALQVPPDIVQRVAKQRCGESRPQVPRDTLGGAAPTTFEQSVARLGVQMAEALAVMHDLGILHRDLKPTNVLLTPAGRPVLLDFNLSAAMERGDILLGGTIPYMPPEYLEALVVDLASSEAQTAEIDGRLDTDTAPLEAAGTDDNPDYPLRGNSAAERAELVRRVRFGGRLTPEERPTVRGFRPRSHSTLPTPTAGDPSPGDPRSDIYSFGVILYELLCGRLPYREPSQGWPLLHQAEWMMIQQAERIPTACKELRRYSPQWRDILRRCLAFEVEERFENARQLKDELRRLAPRNDESFGIAEPVDSTAARPHRRLRVILAIASSLVGLALILYGVPRAPMARGPASAERAASAGPAGSSALDRPVVFPSRWEVDTWQTKGGLYDRATRDTLRRLDRAMLPLRNLVVTTQQLNEVHQELERLLPASNSCSADVQGCLAYCNTRLQNHARAVAQYMAALNERDALRYIDIARLHNGLAYSLMQVGRLDLAQQHANQAVTLPGDATHYAAAHHNRAFLTMRIVERDVRRSDAGRERLTNFDYHDVLADLERSRHFGSSSIKFHFDAAGMYANAAVRLDRDEYRERAARDLAESLRQGLDPRVLRVSGPNLTAIITQHPELAARVPSPDTKTPPPAENNADRSKLKLPSSYPAPFNAPPSTPRLQKTREPTPPNAAPRDH